MGQEAYISRELTRLGRLTEIASDQSIAAIEVMPGGLTNHNYKIILKDGFTVAARVPGEGTIAYIDREAEKQNLTLMGILKIAPEIYYYDAKTGTQLTEFINAETMHPENFQNDTVLLGKAAALIRSYHESGLTLANTFSPTAKIHAYEKVLKDAGFTAWFTGIKELRQILRRVEDVQRSAPPKRVPCHNDLLSENFLYDGRRLTLIDWEFAGMNDPYFDLAAFLIENQLSRDFSEIFLTCYCGQPPTVKDRARLLVNSFLLDAFVCHWALMQLNAGKEEKIYQPYGEERLARCLDLGRTPAFTSALNAIAEET